MKGKILVVIGGVALAVCMSASMPFANDQDNGRGFGSGDEGEDDGLIFGAGGGTDGWETRPGDIVWTTDKVGIKLKNPTAQLDVKGDVRFRNDLEVGGSVTVARDDLIDAMVVLNRSTYNHPDSDVALEFGIGTNPFIVAAIEDSSEGSGYYGDGDIAVIWSPGDGASGLDAALILLDEDDWDDNDADPYDFGAVVAYLNTSGMWIASDINCKQNIEPLFGATDALMHINGYTYEYRLARAEIAKGQEPVRVAGLIAQEVIEVLPEAVSVSDSGEHFINLTSVTPLLVEALKEQIILNAENQARIDDLEARLAALELGLARNPDR